MEFEKILVPNIGHSENTGRIPVSFLVGFGKDRTEARLELGSFRLGTIEIKLIDASQNYIMDEQIPMEDPSQHLLIKVTSLPVGKYFCEVSDGFFCQVKEVKEPV